MTAGMDLDRRIAGYLADIAPDRAPDRLLEDSLSVVGLTTQRPARRVRPLERVERGWQSLSAGRRALLVAATLITLLGVAAAGALLLREPAPRIPTLVLVRPVDAADPSRGITVLLDDGVIARELGPYDAAALGGPWNGSTAAVGPTGLLALGIQTAPDDTVALVDLREALDRQRLDLPGYGAAWSADGAHLAVAEDSRILVYDVESGMYRTVPWPAEIGAVGVGLGPDWTPDGSIAVHGEAVDGTMVFGSLGLDGGFTAGPAPVDDPGVGPRRIRADGTLLRCSAESDGECEAGDLTLSAIGGDATTAYTHADPSVRIADYAWAVDGGFWLLTDAVAPGERSSTLVRVDAEGVATKVATFDVGLDDPDPESYCPGGRFAAMAPDDSRLVVSTAGSACAVGPSYVVTAGTGETTVVDGTAAGWLDPDALERPRTEPASVAEAPADALGDWGRGFGGRDDLPGGPQRIQIGRGLTTIVAGPTTVELSTAAAGDDRLVFTLVDAAVGCPAGSRGTYTWRVSGAILSLAADDEPCVNLRALLEGTFERSLTLSGDHQTQADAGRTYLWPEFGIRVTMPNEPPTVLWSFSGADLRLGADPGHWVLQAAPQPAGDLDWAVRKVGQVVRLRDLSTTTVAGRPAVTATIDAIDDTGMRRTSIWGDQDRGGSRLRDGARLILFTHPHGDVYSIVSWDGGDPAIRAWADALTASIDFTVD